MWNKNIETFLGCDKAYDEAKIAVYGAPFDSTTSYRPGTRFASRTMRGESYGLETYSPYQDLDLEDAHVFDCGDLELCIGDAAIALDQITEAADTLLLDGKLPFMIGGEHLVTLGAVRAVVKRYPDLHILHFDAHADLRDEYLGAPLSHAAVLHRCWDLIGDNRIFQFGIRSGDRSEFAWAKRHVTMHKFDLEGLDEVLKQLKGHPVYVTVDLDVLDVSVFPGTGTPEAGGVGFIDLLNALIKTAELDVVGCDMVELAPNLDPSGISTAVALKLMREWLLALNQNR